MLSFHRERKPVICADGPHLQIQWTSMTSLFANVDGTKKKVTWSVLLATIWPILADRYRLIAASATLGNIFIAMDTGTLMIQGYQRFTHAINVC